MQDNVQASKHYFDDIAFIERKLDSVVDEGSDDDLFIASYLQGHFAVESRRLEAHADSTLETLMQVMQTSLDQAFENGELEESDQSLVLTLWQNLCHACKHRQ